MGLIRRWRLRRARSSTTAEQTHLAQTREEADFVNWLKPIVSSAEGKKERGEALEACKHHPLTNRRD